jgi:hypothetical protein
MEKFDVKISFRPIENNTNSQLSGTLSHFLLPKEKRESL